MDARTDRISDSIEEQIAELRAQVEQLVRTGGHAARGLAERAKHDGAELAHSAQEGIEEGMDRAVAEVRERPLTSLAIAAAVGWLVGRLAR